MRYGSQFYSVRRLTSIFGALMAVFGGVYFFNVAAKTDDVKSFNVLGACQAGNCVRNGKIVYSLTHEIFTINPDGTGQKNLTNTAGSEEVPSWSPDGRSIVFFAFRENNWDVYKMNADGSNVTRLTNNTAIDQLASYSPDGSTIVFVSNRDGNYEIYKMNADGTNQVRLTNDAGDQFDPAFSPDGQKILYVGGVYNTANPLNLFTMNVDGSNPQPIPGGSGNPSQSYSMPSYSSDGSKIIFTYTSDQNQSNGRTWTMNSDGTNRTLFGGSQGSYSPDGTKVVYKSFEVFNQPNRLFVSNADGSSAQNLVESNPVAGFYGLDWQPINVTRLTPFDFDADGRSDIAVFRPSDGVWHLLRSQSGYTSLQLGLSTDVLAPADYDGDLKTDVAVWRPSDGNFYILNSFNATLRIENFGLAGDVPTGGDWDGDGKADVAVFRSGAQGVFYYRASLGNPQGNITYLPWGTNGDKPVADDYDGDGRTDAAIYRNGNWWISRSSTGQFTVTNFGLANDVLVPEDYDGDGKTDIAVYRDGIWYLLRSTQGFAAFQFGVSGDIPTPADYDGDGLVDAAIYRNGVWWTLKSQSGAAEVVQFGLGSDKPIPSAFVR